VNFDSSKDGSVEHYYQHFYRKMIGLDSTGLLSLLWKYPHWLMERNFKSNKGKSILELGVGEGEHIQFVTDDFDKYVAYDLDGDRLQLISGFGIPNLQIQQGDAQQLSFPDATFDRLIATCLLVHLEDPEKALREWERVLKPGGTLTIYVPCEPGLALKLFRKFITKPKAKKMGYDGYDLFIARDHKTSADRVITLCRYIFGDGKMVVKYYPFLIKSWYLNLFSVIHIKKD
jgi:phosphatidylethanolamine/phosphatidyl-N-methylethanolamine N-methyltransferase